MAKVVTLLPSEITQFADQVRIRLISQLIKSTSRNFHKLPKYFNDIAIFAFIIPYYCIISFI